MTPELRLQMRILRKNMKTINECAIVSDGRLSTFDVVLKAGGLLSKEAETDLITEVRRQRHQIAIRDEVIAELRSQLKDAQDKPDVDDSQLIGATYSPPTLSSWPNKEPEGDNGDYARGLRT